jgi:hypothetical protein
MDQTQLGSEIIHTIIAKIYEAAYFNMVDLNKVRVINMLKELLQNYCEKTNNYEYIDEYNEIEREYNYIQQVKDKYCIIDKCRNVREVGSAYFGKATHCLYHSYECARSCRIIHCLHLTCNVVVKDNELYCSEHAKLKINKQENVATNATYQIHKKRSEI